MKLVFMKTQAGFVPADEETREAMARIKIGEVIHGTFTKMRNYRFHKKGMGLIRFAFEYFEPAITEYRGIPVVKDFEKFREDITIAAGHYELVVNVRQEVRAKAKSINFSSLDDLGFERVYRSILNAAHRLVLNAKGFSEESIEKAVLELCKYE